uniref:Uncharacterized protein n=1 Tax=Spironucleus salmonicida TaxID=348837 RepID=V6LK98_9EUKA|eukprot:EST44977.1 Hypothetical protein SS50377_14996 [Spironucleus salmonicida]
MNYAPIYIFTGNGKLTQLILEINASYMRVYYKDQFTSFDIRQVTVSIDKNTAYLFKLKINNTYICYSNFRDNIIAMLLNIKQFDISFLTQNFNDILLNNDGLVICNQFVQYTDLKVCNDHILYKDSQIYLIDQQFYNLFIKLVQFFQSCLSKFNNKDYLCNNNSHSTSHIDIERSAMLQSYIQNLEIDKKSDIFIIEDLLVDFHNYENKLLIEQLLLSNEKFAIYVQQYGLLFFKKYITALQLNVLPVEFVDIDKDFSFLYYQIQKNNIICQQKLQDNQSQPNINTLKKPQNTVLTQPDIAVLVNEKQNTDNIIQEGTNLSYQDEYQVQLNDQTRTLIMNSSKANQRTNFTFIQQSIKILKTPMICQIYSYNRLKHIKISLNPLFDYQTNELELYYTFRKNIKITFNGDYMKFVPVQILKEFDIQQQFLQFDILNWKSRTAVLQNKYSEKIILIFATQVEKEQFCYSLGVIMSFKQSQ